MIKEIGVISIIIGIYIFYKIICLYKKKIFTEYEILLWSFFGSMSILIGINQSFLDYFMEFLNFTSRANLIFTISILSIFVILLKLYIRNKNLEKQLTEAVREFGIEKYEKEIKTD